MTVQIAIQLIIQVVLPGIFIADLLRKIFGSKREWLIEVCILGLLLLFVFLTARWDAFSYYLRILMPLLYLAASFIAYRKIDTSLPTRKTALWLSYILQTSVILVLVWLNVNALRAYIYADEAVVLSSPLKDGVYYVGGGGNSRWVNNHNAFPPQNYALDIVRLNVAGNRANGLAPKDLEKYTIFGDTLYSPCDGQVVIALDALADQIPPSSGQLAGNHIVITCKGVDVLLAHLKKNSIVISTGDNVEEGQAIGRVGNSGNSSQPHLHIHAEKGGIASKILDGQGVPIKFNGRFLVRNDVFTGN